ncbi:MAG: mucoidy inhibitor MuiA family protein [Bacteroidetes bacterium]|nr:mucoidy inhibitor MuiA family protein [Bacteroidota bacterium]
MRAILLILFFISIQVSAKDIDLKTTITDVTVFQSGAQVKRIGSTKIPAGESQIIISDATSLLKKESIQVKGEGDFTILSVNFQAKLEDVENEKGKWADLELKQKSLMQQMEDLSVKIQTLNSQEAAIMNLKDISTTTKGVTVEQIGKAQELVRLKLTEIKTEKLKFSRQILDLFEDHKTITQHLVALKTPKQKIHYEIVVKVSALTAVLADFIISYIVPNAQWFPTYDLRVNSVTEPMLIEYKANVSQESGEDWTNVSLKLSTGDPSQSPQKPKIDPWWLYLNQGYVQPQKQNNFYKYTDIRFTKVNGTIINAESGEPIPWCNIIVSGTNIGTTADAEGSFSLVLPENAKQLYFYSIGFIAQTIAISEKNPTIKLQKQEMPLNETVKTDYERALMNVQSPVFSTDYEGVLSNLEVPVISNYDLMVMDANGASVGYATGAGPGTYSYNISDNKSVNYLSSEIKQIDAKKIVATKTLNIVSTEFSIDEKYTIPSDPKKITVSIQSIKTDAKYQYYCAPRFDKDVFITAQLTNWEQYNLLEGQANVFFEETFTGSTFFDTRFLVDTLEISLGRDKGIKVERKKSKEFNKSQVVGNDNIAYRDWDISVYNSKPQPIDIIVEDQFPVSVDSKVVVSQEEKSNGVLNETTGIVSWPFKLNPSETKKLQLKYKVKYPKGNYIGLD